MMKTKNKMSVSVGGFYLRSLAVGAAYAHKFMQFDEYIAGSAGCPIVIMCAVHGPEKMLETAFKIDLRKGYKYIPYNKKGRPKFRAILRHWFGKNGIGIQESRPLLRQIVSEKDWKRWQDDESAPRCYVYTVDLEAGEGKKHDLKTMSRSAGIDAMEASMRMQYVTAGLRLYGGYHVDSGQLELSPAQHIADDPELKNLVCVYSWPEQWKAKPIKIDDRDGYKILARTIELDQMQKAAGDMAEEDKLQKKHGFKSFRIHTERHLIHPFDMDPRRQRLSQLSTSDSAKEAFKGMKKLES